jgi:hypothetical protein
MSHFYGFVRVTLLLTSIVIIKMSKLYVSVCLR